MFWIISFALIFVSPMLGILMLGLGFFSIILKVLSPRPGKRCRNCRYREDEQEFLDDLDEVEEMIYMGVLDDDDEFF